MRFKIRGKKLVSHNFWSSNINLYFEIISFVYFIFPLNTFQLIGYELCAIICVYNYRYYLTELLFFAQLAKVLFVVTKSLKKEKNVIVVMMMRSARIVVATHAWYLIWTDTRIIQPEDALEEQIQNAGEIIKPFYFKLWWNCFFLNKKRCYRSIKTLLKDSSEVLVNTFYVNISNIIMEMFLLLVLKTAFFTIYGGFLLLF